MNTTIEPMRAMAVAPVISSTGFWDAKTSPHVGHNGSRLLIQWVADYLKGTEAIPVYDFGCGPGDYAKFLQRAGYRVTGFEGEVPDGAVTDCIVQQDLTIPFTVPETGSVICIEVAEHIPPEHEAAFLSNLVGACNRHMILSWAYRGQGGSGHVNELNGDEVIDKMRSVGMRYLHDETMSLRQAVNGCWATYFRRNVVVLEKGAVRRSHYQRPGSNLLLNDDERRQPPLRLHMVATPSISANHEKSHGFAAEALLGLCAMMKAKGHYLTLYAGEGIVDDCSELVPCITKQEQKDWTSTWGDGRMCDETFDADHISWRTFSERCIKEIGARLQPTDLILFAAGPPAHRVVDAFPSNVRCEPIIGSYGVYDATHHVWPSYAAMHFFYGKRSGDGHGRGHFYDRVIPDSIDESLFPLVETKQPHLLWFSRTNEDKGLQVAIDVARRLSAELVAVGIGPGTFPSWVKHTAFVSNSERAAMLGNASAVFVPSLYIEPLGKVSREAMMCGTPAITTDWGGFVDAIEPRWRCHTLAEFCTAARDALDGKYSPLGLRERAIASNGRSAIADKFDVYFRQLHSLYTTGFYS